MQQLSIRDIARMAGVSVATVSRVLNGYPDVSSQTRERIEKLIADSGYQPNNAARNLKRRSNHAVGLLMEGSATGFMTALADVLEQRATQRGYMLAPHRVTNGVSGVDTAVQLAMEKRLQGLIICGGYFIHTEEELRRLPVPTVFCTTDLLGIDPALYSSVRVNDRQAAFAAVEYLCGLGHRRIAILGGIENDRGGVSSRRLRGYCDALEKHGIPVEPALLRYCGLFTMQRGYEAARALLAGPVRPTALFCVADQLALGACRAVFDAGLQVPGDISVMGFDGMDMAAFYNPSLCTVRQPAQDIAEKTISLLLDLIEKDGENRHFVLPTRIVQGESCAAPRGQASSSEEA